jgi:glycosyltransferase involved in cell wall biosynthesis
MIRLEAGSEERIANGANIGGKLQMLAPKTCNLSAKARSVAFISTMVSVPWGGSEELWSRTALSMARNGWRVGASVHGWSPPHERISRLVEAGIEVQSRTSQNSFLRRLSQKLYSSGKTAQVAEVEKFLSAISPALVMFSDGGAFQPIELLELCVSKNLPFVTISHVNHDGVWPEDELASRYREILPSALRCYFVSNGNRSLFEKQIGCKLPNTAIVRNPFNVDVDISLPWPFPNPGLELKIASVGRLHPPSKGQDILLEALADPLWRSRSWRLSLYGEGPMRNSLERMIGQLGLQDRVRLLGFVTPVENIWAENEVLVMPSRYEGLPLAMVEAMLCSRPVVATDVAGHAEIIEDGVNGFLAEAATVSSMKKALAKLWERRTELETMGKAAARTVRTLIPRDPIGAFVKEIEVLAAVRGA